MKLEVVVLPVSNVDDAKDFYRSAGFREDIDYVCGEDFRIVQFTPPGSGASIIFGTGITAAAPGSVQGLQLVVGDIAAARADLTGRGVNVGDVFHDMGGVFYHLSPAYEVPGPDPARRDYGSFARFCDPDGNGWVLQEVRQRRQAADRPRAGSGEEEEITTDRLGALQALFEETETADGVFETTELLGGSFAGGTTLEAPR